MLTPLLLRILQLLLLPVVFGTWTTPRTWVPGELVTASQMNTHLRDNLNSLRSEHFGVQGFRGLHLRTHPDADLAAAQVWMTADEIVMDDGTRLAFTTPVSANIAASGAAGLDTGAEAASTWYEAYAIAKDDGTKNLLLHRAKDYFEDETSTAGEDGQHLLRDAAARTRLGQGFKVDTAGKIEFVDIKIAKIGAPTGEVYVTVQNDTAGVPGTTIHATSDKLDVSALNTTSTFIRFVFRAPFTTVAATQYHLVLNGTFAVSAVNHVLWRADTTAGAYANGSKAEANNGTWTADADDDFIFKIFVTRNDAAVTMPATYTKKAKVGYAFNNSGSNLDPFVAVDRHVFPMTVLDSGAVTASTPQLIDFSIGLPATLIWTEWMFYSSVADDVARASPVPDGFNSGGKYIQAVGLTTQDTFGGGLATEFQAIYVTRTSGTGNVQARLRAWSW